TDEEIELPVTVIIEPDGGVGIDPVGKPGLIGYACKAFTGIIMIKLRLPPLVNEHVLVSIVVVIAPHRTHGNAIFARVFTIRPIVSLHLYKCAVSQVSKENVLGPFAAIGEVNVLPAVTVEIHHRDSCAHRSDLRHNVVEIGIELWSDMGEVDP